MGPRLLVALLLTAGVGAVLFLAGGVTWPFTGWEYAAVVGAAAYLAGMYYMLLSRTPALDRMPVDAVVTGIHRPHQGGSESPDYQLLTVQVDTPSGSFDSILADILDPDEHHRFPEGTRCTVYRFAKSEARVLLTEAYEHVYRCGHDFSTVRWGLEHSYHSPSTPGSSALQQRFKPPTAAAPATERSFTGLVVLV